MSSGVHSVDDIRRLGSEYGRDLAAALVLASDRAGDDRALKRQMAGLVLGEIAAALEKLRNAAISSDLIEVYERGAREGVRDELLKSKAIAAQVERRAA